MKNTYKINNQFYKQSLERKDYYNLISRRETPYIKE